MIGLGQIATLGRSSLQAFEARLFQEIATVDQTEAEEGALRSDSVRLKSQRQDSSQDATMKDVVARLAELKSPAQVQPEQEETEPCQIAEARRRSLTGENAPLGWLTSDQVGEEPDFDDMAWPELVAPQEFDSKESILRPSQTQDDDEDFIFANEWFLSPCG